MIELDMFVVDELSRKYREERGALEYEEVWILFRAALSYRSALAALGEESEQFEDDSLVYPESAAQVRGCGMDEYEIRLARAVVHKDGVAHDPVVELFLCMEEIRWDQRVREHHARWREKNPQ